MAEHTGEKPVEKIKSAAQQAAKAETTSPPKREYRAIFFQIALIAAIAAFGVLIVIIKSAPLLTLDLQITHGLQSIDSPIFAALMSLISWPGFSPQSFILSLLIVLAIYFLGLHWEAVAALVAALLPPVLNVLVKDIIRRPRPTVDLVHVLRILNSYSFPSGHVMFYVGFFGFLWFLAYTLLKHSLKRTLLLILFGSLIALIGASRIYLGQHWASDVLGAYLLGSLTLVVILQFYRWGKQRFFVRQPVAAEKPGSTK
jgi:undecaprenyl-diphosphatase